MEIDSEYTAQVLQEWGVAVIVWAIAVFLVGGLGFIGFLVLREWVEHRNRERARSHHHITGSEKAKDHCEVSEPGAGLDGARIQ